jgi:hypothetical protein
MHLKKRSNNEMSDRIMDSKFKGSNRVGKPKLRWMDAVVRYVRIQRWWMVAGDRESWKKVLREAKGLSGL